ncbi:FMN-binding protein [Mobilitalea sibirica]|uniref:FMN-binding protein n=1 Tax=Mobilitalea sibirica TaxID=1462919 RepID=A0A8J7KXJ1_9FIRM|nr:FMN-binding protein [Mobilitalea sibirica]MBH1941847.1 FMN-binding protein [Mobilitalea sibirica]
MKKLLVFLLSCSLLVLMTGCTKEEEQEKDNTTVTDNSTTENTQNNPKEDEVEAENNVMEEASDDDSKVVENTSENDGDINIAYKDGTYEYETVADAEGFKTKGTVTIENGKIAKVDWTIFDTYRDDRPFDETYEEVYEGNDLYMQQSRDDWNGSRGYAEKLIETQDLEEVDAVSGATWTNRKFKTVMSYILFEAKE